MTTQFTYTRFEQDRLDRTTSITAQPDPHHSPIFSGLPRNLPQRSHGLLATPFRYSSILLLRGILASVPSTMWSALRAPSFNPSLRTRRLATSTFFIATFAASILTVSLSASTILPCPANSRSKSRGTLAEEGEMGGIGQKVHLTRKGGWIEIEQPVRRASILEKEGPTGKEE